ncbi:MAG: hypothetical protein AAF333_17845 [Planctomycetota bacterium]
MSSSAAITYQPVVPEPSEVTAALARHAQQVIGELVERLGGLPAQPADGVVPLFLFESEWAYQNHMSEVFVRGISTGSHGVFYRHEDVGLGLALFTRGMPVFDLMTTIQHECFHHAAFMVFGESLPRWLNEGLAQYFQDALWRRGKLTGGMANPDRLERLRHPQYRRAGIAELIDTPDEAWFAGPANSGFDVSRLYESSWLVVVAMIVGPSVKLRRALSRYLGMLRRPGVDHDRAWGLAMDGVRPAEIDDAAAEVLTTLNPPSVCDAIHKMTLLAMILGMLNEQNQRMPATMEEASLRMRMLGVEVFRRVPGAEPIRYRGDDERLHYYEVEDGLSTTFELTPPARPQQPPGLHAPGVLGEPRLRWVGRGRRCVPWVELEE